MNNIFMMSFILVLFVGTASCAGNRHHDLAWGGSELAKAKDDFAWQDKGPLEFIDFLKAEFKNRRIAMYTVWSYHRGWIRKSDIPALRALLESKEPCAALQSPLRSSLQNSSTVGIVAKQLIEGFESGGFPAWNDWIIRQNSDGREKEF